MGDDEEDRPVDRSASDKRWGTWSTYPPLSEGDRVKIKGFKHYSSLNGCAGVVEEKTADGRYHVAMSEPRGCRVMWVKPEHLVTAKATSPDSDCAKIVTGNEDNTTPCNAARAAAADAALKAALETATLTSAAKYAIKGSNPFKPPILLMDAVTAQKTVQVVNARQKAVQVVNAKHEGTQKAADDVAPAEGSNSVGR